MAVLIIITARLLAVFKSNRSCHALPSINRVISCPQSLKWRRYWMHLLRRFRSPSSCSCRPRLRPSSCFFVLYIPGLPPPPLLRALWSEIDEEVCTGMYSMYLHHTIGGVRGGRCCVHGEGVFLGIIRYRKPMRVFRRF